MRRRVIPVLLLDRDKRLVKTVQFGERTYIGDPFNAVRLFNEKEVDELCVLDIDATADGREPDFDFLEALAAECFMPLSYGGGITSLEQCAKLSRNAVEKFVLGTKGADFDFVKEMAGHFGSQAVTVCVDAKLTNNRLDCCTRNGSNSLDIAPLDYCRALQNSGAGEILLQAMQRDGMRSGYDLPLIETIAKELTIPLVALGGAGTKQHLADALAVGAEAVASGSAFIFVGRLRAVLITYPTPKEIFELSSALQ